MKVECLSPPALVVISGKKYIVPLWQEVPMETELTDLEWSRPGTTEPENPIIKEEFVTGSTGNEYFVRLFKDGKGECECWGFRRHKKDCRHIRILKKNI
jgi:hypothetical protein